MPTWSPEQYLRFGAERLRPARDLLARVPLDAPGIVYDLGCGPGTATVLLRERWPRARITGVDSSEAMLEKARALDATIDWRAADLSTWTPDAFADLMVSNAALHWLDSHETLLPRLFRELAPGGALAVQMPAMFSAPIHAAISETIGSGPWRERLRPYLRERPILDMASYRRILESIGASLDIWETTYLHVLEGEDPVVEWARGSALRPFLDRLDASEGEAFLHGYRDRIRQAYPPEADGATLLPFRRLFLVAVRGKG